MHFNTWGPFDFSADEPRWKAAFWDNVAVQERKYEWPEHQVRRAIGCYLFATAKGKSYIPWYVGKTLASAGFEGEIFQDHKLAHYEQSMLLSKRKVGKIFLFPLITSGKDPRFSHATKSSRKTIDWLERMLMGMALGKNAELRNIRDMRFLREVWVEGVFGGSNPGRPSHPAAEARKALLD